jgi:hypothetical protein
MHVTTYIASGAAHASGSTPGSIVLISVVDGNDYGVFRLVVLHRSAGSPFEQWTASHNQWLLLRFRTLLLDCSNYRVGYGQLCSLRPRETSSRGEGHKEWSPWTFLVGFKAIALVVRAYVELLGLLSSKTPVHTSQIRFSSRCSQGTVCP